MTPLERLNGVVVRATILLARRGDAHVLDPAGLVDAMKGWATGPDFPTWTPAQQEQCVEVAEGWFAVLKARAERTA